MKKKSSVGWGAILGASWVLLGATVLAAEPGAAETAAASGDVYRTIGLGAAAALAIAISVLGAGQAVGKIGSAAVGAAVEKPELLNRCLIFMALAEGLAVLGFAIAMMLIQKI